MTLWLTPLALVIVIGIFLYRPGESSVPAAILWPIKYLGKHPLSVVEGAGVLIAFFTLRLKQLRRFLVKQRIPHGEGLAGSVVYLRSFTTDSLMGIVQGEGLAPTTEEILAEAMSDFGKLLALGHPQEGLPELGAERLYICDGTWQATIGKWLSRANLVIVSVGLTKNLQWEIQAALKTVSPERLVLLLPASAIGYERFRNSLGPSFPKGIPKVNFLEYSIAGLGGLSGFIYFDQDWVPCYVPLEFIETDLYGSSGIVTTFRRALHPVYQALQVRPSTEPWWVSRWLAARHLLHRPLEPRELKMILIIFALGALAIYCCRG